MTLATMKFDSTNYRNAELANLTKVMHTLGYSIKTTADGTVFTFVDTDDITRFLSAWSAWIIANIYGNEEYLTNFTAYTCEDDLNQVVYTVDKETLSVKVDEKRTQIKRMLEAC